MSEAVIESARDAGERQKRTRSPISTTRVRLSGGAKFYLLFLVLLFAILNASVNYWGYLGYPSADVFANWTTAQNACLNLANENRSQLLSGGENSLKVQSEWIRKGKIVVELAIKKNESDSTFTSRLCVVGDGQTEIVPGLAEAGWE